MKQALKPIKRRIRFLRFVRGLLIGLLCGAGLSLALLIVSFFIPIENAWQYMLMLFAAGLVLGGLIGALLPVGTKTAARRADQTGLKERTITALWLDGDDTPMAKLQRADAEAQLKALPLSEAMPVRISRRLWIPTAAIALVCCAMLLIPNPQNDVLRARDMVRKELSAQADELEKAADKMEQDDLTDEEKRELRRITGEMAKELREADDKREALEKLAEKQEDMDKLQRDIQQRQTESLTSALSQQSSLKGLSQAMESGSEGEMEEALSELAEKMETTEGQNELAEQLAEAAEAIDAIAAKMGLSASAAAAANGNTGQMLSQIAGVCSNPSASAGNTGANVAALMRMARSGAASSGTGSGSGAGMGQSQGGGGAGQGTTQKDAGYSEGAKASSGSMGGMSPTERVGEYERIYDPTRVGGDNESSFVEGEKHEGEQQQIDLGPGSGSLEGTVPYNQVIGDYREAASQAMRRTSLPATMQDWVSRYFDALVD